MRSAMNAAAAELSLPPCSISCSVWARTARRSLSAPYQSVTRAEIPAVVIEACRVGDLANLVERLALDDAEADDHVGHLDTGIVDVVLHLDRNTAEAEHPHQRVAECGVPQVADVRGLVRIDCRVFDDGFAGVRMRGRAGVPETLEQERPAFKEEVQVSVWRRGHGANSLEGPERAGDLLRDRPRRLAQPACQLEGDRRAEVAKVAIGRVFERDGRQRRLSRA